MSFKERYLSPFIVSDLAEKMVFLGGPRQVGKTTLSMLVGEKHYHHPHYFNWDRPEDRKSLLKEAFSGSDDVVIFDELHKYKGWKNYVKGMYDTYASRFDIIVTGSSHLDVYRKGGDSLQGRYHFYRLHPFSLSELAGVKTLSDPFQELSFSSPSPALHQHFSSLLTFGGFPEPLFHQDEVVLRRWNQERVERLIREDIRDMESIRDISAIQILVNLLEEKAAGRFSLNSLREDLLVTHKTIALWVDILERFYYHFRIYPYAAKTIASLRKEPKLYLWDWSCLDDPGRRLENLVASHLLKFVHFLHDAKGFQAELFYLRDNTGREVDFLVTIKRKPWFAVEVKHGDRNPSPHLQYFGERLKIPWLYQVIHTPGIDILQKGVHLMSVEYFLSALV